MRVLGDFEGDGVDAGYDFGGGQRVAGAVDQLLCSVAMGVGLALTGR